MTGEPVLSATRMATGDQNFVYAVKTAATADETILDNHIQKELSKKW